MFTRTDATNLVTTSIEAGAATADEFDIDQIVDDLYEVAGDWDFTNIDEADFWPVVERHAR